MEMPVNRFKRSLGGHEVPVGTWLMSASTAAAEGLCCLGFDFSGSPSEEIVWARWAKP